MLLTDTVRRSQPDDFAFPIERIDGELPAGLDGVLFRNGGGIMQAGDRALAFLDSYSLVGALEIADGAAFFRSTHPETDVLVEERRAGTMTRRRIFTNLPGWRRNIANIRPTTAATHDSYVWAGRVHAADLGTHTALSLPDLKTVGTAPWQARKGQLVAPMPRDDPRAGRLVSYLLQQTPIGNRITLVEVDEDFAEVARSGSFILRGLIHDVGFTDDWYVLVEMAARPKPATALLGRVPLWWSFGWADRPPTVVLVPRGRDGDVVRIPMEPSATIRTAFHIINAHQDGDEVVADLTTFDSDVPFDIVMPAGRDDPRPTPDNRIARIRTRPDAATATVTLYDASGEAPEVSPAVHGQRHSAAWFAALPASGAADPGSYLLSSTVGRLDVDSGETTTWDAGDGHQLSPPAFAPDPAGGPEDGWILAWDLDLEAESTDVVILDADDLPAGPIARVHLDVYLPAVSHCRFAPGVRVRG